MPTANLYAINRDENEDGSNLYHQTLDVFTNTFNKASPFHDDAFYEILCRRRLLRFFASLPEYEALAADDGGHFTTSRGEVFTRRTAGHGRLSARLHRL